jgi:hypothetical protein
LAGLVNEITPAVTVALPQDSSKVGSLKLGIYLIVNTSVPGRYIAANPFLAYLPISENSAWIYEITAHPKLGYDSGGSTTTTTRSRGGTTTPTITPLPTTQTTTVNIDNEGPPYDAPTTPWSTEPAPSDAEVIGDPKLPGGDADPPGEGKELKDPKLPFGLPQTGMLQWPSLVLSFCGAALITSGVVVNKKKRNRQK